MHCNMFALLQLACGCLFLPDWSVVCLCFYSSEHKGALSLLAAGSLLLIFILVQRRCSLVSKIALVLGLLGVYSYRAAVGNVLFPWQQDGRDLSK